MIIISHQEILAVSAVSRRKVALHLHGEDATALALALAEAVASENQEIGTVASVVITTLPREGNVVNVGTLSPREKWAATGVVMAAAAAAAAAMAMAEMIAGGPVTGTLPLSQEHFNECSF